MSTLALLLLFVARFCSAAGIAGSVPGEDSFRVIDKAHEDFGSCDLSPVNHWSRVIPSKSNSPSGRLGHTAVVVSKFGYFNDHVMIVYGGVNKFMPSKTAAQSSHWHGDLWVYSPESNSWINMTEASFIPRAYHSAVVIHQEMIVFGGSHYQESLNDTWHFSLSDGVWREGAYGPGQRFLHAAVSLEEHMLVFFGQKYSWISDKQAYCYDDVWRYEPYKRIWILLNPSPDPDYGKPLGRAGHTAVYFKGKGIVLILGGEHCNLTSVLDDLWEYNVKSNSWRRRQPLSYQILNHIAVSFVNTEEQEVMFVFGGMTYKNNTRHIAQNQQMFLYNVNNDLWEDGTPVDFHALPPRRLRPTAVMMSFIMILFGGEDLSTLMPLDDLWEMYVYSDVNKSLLWQRISYPDIEPPPRSGASMVSLDHTAVLFGGYDGSTLSDPYTWVYDACTAMWSEINAVAPSVRISHAAIAYSTDSVLISGGFAFSYAHSNKRVVFSMLNVSVFNVTSFQWVDLAIIVSSKDDKPVPRGSHVLFKDNNGDIQMHGGLFIEQSKNGYRILDDQWIISKQGKSLYWRRVDCKSPPCPSVAGHSAVTLLDGRVMVYGGMSKTFQSMDDLWTYDVKTNRWTLMYFSSSQRPPASVYHSAAAYGYKMFVYGGCEITSIQSPFVFDCSKVVDNKNIWLFDGTVHSWSLLHMLNNPKPRFGQSLSILSVSNQSALLMFGGFELAVDFEGRTVRPAGATFVSVLGCNAGEFSSNFSVDPCTPCPKGTYASSPGMEECDLCPSGTTTLSIHSMNESSCSVCSADICHSHGDCQVLANSQIQCQCNFGYDSRSRCKSIQLSIVLLGFIILLSVAMIAVVVLLVFRHQRYKQQQMRAFCAIQLSQKAVKDLQGAFQIDSNEITFRERVDSDSPGGFGEVWLAEYRDLPVAVKKLKQSLIEPSFERHFAREIEFMKTIRHTNIVLFIGVGYVPPNNQAILVTEYLRRGALRTILQNPDIPIEYSQKLRFSSDAAKGMRFLHNLTPPRIHRDLKCGNLLVSDRWIVKVADFGTARLIEQLTEPQIVDKEPDSITPHRITEGTQLLEAHKLMSESVGTLLWRAPETFFENKYGAAVDVYR
jgi:hypothetical protein